MRQRGLGLFGFQTGEMCSKRVFGREAGRYLANRSTSKRKVRDLGSEKTACQTDEIIRARNDKPYTWLDTDHTGLGQSAIQPRCVSRWVIDPLLTSNRSARAKTHASSHREVPAAWRGRSSAIVVVPKPGTKAHAPRRSTLECLLL